MASDRLQLRCVGDGVRGGCGSIAVASFSDEILRRSDELARTLLDAANEHAELTASSSRRDGEVPSCGTA